MKKLSMLVLLAAGVVASSLVWADHHEGDHQKAGKGHSKWFDATACDVCKPWVQDPALMMSTKWESHSLKNGMLMVSLVPDEQLEKFKQVCKKMDMTIAKLEAGEKPAGLCGFCEAMGGLKMAGAKIEKVDTKFGNITIVTSENPETVKKIHATLKRTQEEAKKMAEMMKKAAA